MQEKKDLVKMGFKEGVRMNKPRSNGKWVCKQHGENCKSYVEGMIREWSEKGYTPENLIDEEKKWLKLVRWVPDAKN